MRFNAGMHFNAIKCYILSICQKSSRFYQLDGKILQEVNSSTYLGITISNDLQWKTNITNIVKKANSTLGFLRRNLKYCTEECKRLSYIALVGSTLEYGAIVWDLYKLQDIKSMEKIQRQAAWIHKKMNNALDLMVAYVKCFGTLSYNRYNYVD